MFKLLLIEVAILFGVCTVAEFHRYTQDELDLMASVHEYQLPRHLQLLLKRGKKMGDNSNWCCKNDANLQINFTSVTKIAYHTIKASVQVHTQASCGFLNTHKCDTTNIQYVEKPVTSIETILVPNRNICPDEQISCCKEFILVADNCLAADGDKLNSLIPALIKLKEAGLLFG